MVHMGAVDYLAKPVQPADRAGAGAQSALN